VFGGWDEEEYDLYATLKGVGPSPYGSLDYRSVLEYVLFVYSVGVSFVYSLYKGCAHNILRVAPLCALYIIFTLLIKKKIIKNSYYRAEGGFNIPIHVY
jgi:hypothetical protein